MYYRWFKHSKVCNRLRFITFLQKFCHFCVLLCWVNGQQSQSKFVTRFSGFLPCLFLMYINYNSGSSSLCSKKFYLCMYVNMLPASLKLEDKINNVPLQKDYITERLKNNFLVKMQLYLLILHWHIRLICSHIAQLKYKHFYNIFLQMIYQ